jgi:predicted dehydrogenase
MDYTHHSLLFKLRKTFRYIQLYGFRRTRIKIMGQYHMKKHFRVMPNLSENDNINKYVGIIGCGNFSFSNVAYYIRKNYGAIINTVVDIDIDKATSLGKYYKASSSSVDAIRIIDDPRIKLVYIASNHASHAEYAIECIAADKTVHIEKPHVVSMDQLSRLCKAIIEHEGKVNLGFNRPNSRFGKSIIEVLETQRGTGMYNWFIAGHEIPPDHWYFKDEEGGRVLGNLCHWSDFVLRLIPESKRYPITITPTRAEQSDCDIAVTYMFGDGSIAAITFSAKGHTFEGVREKFAAHKGNVLIQMNDFKTLTIENIEKQYTKTSIFRDHGHEDNIKKSYDIFHGKSNSYSVNYIWETGELFLKTKVALDESKPITIHSGFSKEILYNQ